MRISKAKWYPIKTRTPPINQNKGGCNFCCSTSLALRFAFFDATIFACEDPKDGAYIVYQDH